MKNYTKSNMLLILGSIYGVILGGLIITFGVLSMGPVNFQSDPITSFFSLFVAFYCILIIACGFASITGVVFGIISMSNHKRGFYRICLILSGVSINPLSIFGALNGIDTVSA